MGSRQSDGRGYRDLAVMLPVAAVLLLMPPLIQIFATSAAPVGIPSIVLYIFAVWAAAILVAVVVARRAHPVPGSDPENRSATVGRR